MKRYFFVFFLLLAFLFIPGGAKVYSDYIEIDLNQRRIKLKGLSLKGYNLSGKLSYTVKESEKGTVFFLDAQDIKFGDREVDQAKIWITKKGDILFVDNFSSSKFSGQGVINLTKKKIQLRFEGNWQEDTEYLKGDVELKAKVWGNFENFSVSGNFIILEGIYEGIPFQQLRCSFLGTPPVFNVTDAEVLLPEGSVFELKGDLNIRDSKNFFPGAEFVSQKLFVDGWQIFGAEEEAGLRKKIDERFDIKVDAETEEETGTELRYSLENDNFLKLRMQEEETILGIERKKEF